MKIKILYVCISVLTIYAILSTMYIAITKPWAEENMQLWGMTDAIPNEETARGVADAIIAAKPVYGYESWFDYVLAQGHDFYAEIRFHAEKNEWLLFYSHITPAEYFVLGGVEIRLRRDNGAVTGFWFG
jgi:hypothetical protein